MNYVVNSHATVPLRTFIFPVIITQTDHAVLPTSSKYRLTGNFNRNLFLALKHWPKDKKRKN